MALSSLKYCNDEFFNFENFLLSGILTNIAFLSISLHLLKPKKGILRHRNKKKLGKEKFVLYKNSCKEYFLVSKKENVFALF